MRRHLGDADLLRCARARGRHLHSRGDQVHQRPLRSAARAHHGTLDALAGVREYCDHSGTHAAPDTCWLTLRGLCTLAVRMERHQRSALAVAQWLQSQPAVQRVLYPALDTDPGHKLWRSQFSGAADPFTIELAPCSEDAFTRFIDHLSLFSLGTSWGGFESLVMPAVPHHLRALDTPADTPRLVRFHIGLESPHDLCDDLASALAAIQGEEDTTAGAPQGEQATLAVDTAS
ncbi:PLP-dependent transferase [Streptomyces dubilierae]|uniref:PLP-dependent transferase n=1 Tax=Streptomyces dubilierae TaxID=3075533 RepID=A0ABU2P2W1_9ACTN|nr:PLP-dependent transferase [Streptomyces sp. DSM 41921]MDT0385984.1 PLP-dependent transferase [Streptomyces sp. DSM 41921]